MMHRTHLRTEIEYEEINGVKVQDTRGYEGVFFISKRDSG